MASEPVAVRIPEVVTRGTQSDIPDTATRGIQVHVLPEVASRSTQVKEMALVEAVSRGTQVQEAGLVELTDPVAAVSTDDVTTDLVEDLLECTLGKIDTVAQNIGLPTDLRCSIPDFVNNCEVSLQWSGLSPPQMHRSSTKSWCRHYTVLSFLLNGHLHSEYEKLSGMLGLPSCSHTTWHKIVEELEEHVTRLADWSCRNVREKVIARGDQEEWRASFDGFYLTRGHHSNNSSATLHDYTTGEIAWFSHRTKRGQAHNWEGTSGGAEGHMLDEVLGKVKADGFILREIITDKDSAMNAIFCKYFPEGTITYCSNHCAKTMHKDLQKVKQSKCEVIVHIINCT